MSLLSSKNSLFCKNPLFFLELSLKSIFVICTKHLILNNKNQWNSRNEYNLFFISSLSFSVEWLQNMSSILLSGRRFTIGWKNCRTKIWKIELNNLGNEYLLIFPSLLVQPSPLPSPPSPLLSNYPGKGSVNHFSRVSDDIWKLSRVTDIFINTLLAHLPFIHKW